MIFKLISILTFLVVLNTYIEQNLYIEELINMAIEREREIEATLTLTRDCNDALQANMELTEARNERIKQVISNLGLGEGLDFYEDKLTVE